MPIPEVQPKTEETEITIEENEGPSVEEIKAQAEAAAQAEEERRRKERL